MYKNVRALVFILAIAVWPVRLARADLLIFDLKPPTMTTSPGGTVEFTGTLTNPGTTDVFLNGVVSILPYPPLTVDPSPFFVFSPLFLAGGETYTGAFFDVAVDPATLFGAYVGSFTIQGGADSNTFNNLASENFEVDVVSSAPVPEPNFFALFTTSVVIIVARRHFHRIG